MEQVLFVCLGNICRSPSAEAVFNSLIEKNGLEHVIGCDSAGTAAYHAGEPSDYRMIRFAKKRGYVLDGTARKFNPKTDFDRFDYIIGMDKQNVRDLKALARNENDLRKIRLMTDFGTPTGHNSVPDPYYGGDEGFELVLDILEKTCQGLLDTIRKTSID